MFSLLFNIEISSDNSHTLKDLLNLAYGIYRDFLALEIPTYHILSSSTSSALGDG
jgi:hypothetical protein